MRKQEMMWWSMCCARRVVEKWERGSKRMTAPFLPWSGIVDRVEGRMERVVRW